ncbi:MAG: hypothetical protein ACI4R6_06630, partial [Lachnospiraceae bacterium]
MKSKKNNNGFFKGLGLGVLLAVVIMALLAGCNGLSSLIGPGSDYKNQQTKEETSGKQDGKDDETSEEKTTEEETTKKSSYGNYTPVSPQLTDEVIEKIDTLMQVVDYYYLYDYDEDAMIDAIYKAVMDSLGDPYSVYYTEDEYKAFLESSSGSYCGIGVVVQQNVETGIVTAVRPYE